MRRASKPGAKFRIPVPGLEDHNSDRQKVYQAIPTQDRLMADPEPPQEAYFEANREHWE
jgi:hypothetical protein